MSAEYVRARYGVDFKRGDRVTIDGKPGTIVSFPDQYLGVRFDETPNQTHRAHPTWRVERIDTELANNEAVAARFWAKVDRREDHECWEWLGGQGTRGHGRVRIRGVLRPAHRVSYELQGREIPTDMVLDHLCRNTACVNPNHLEPVTSGENTLRGEAPTAVNSRKTHCSRGHEFTSENTYTYWDREGSQHRKCRECQRRLNREGTARRSAATGGDAS